MPYSNKTEHRLVLQRLARADERVKALDEAIEVLECLREKRKEDRKVLYTDLLKIEVKIERNGRKTYRNKSTGQYVAKKNASRSIFDKCIPFNINAENTNEFD